MRKLADQSIAVVIPSRLASNAAQRLFVDEAITAARTQMLPRGIRLAFFVGVHLDAPRPAALAMQSDVTFVRSRGRGQAAAINAAAAAAAANNHDFIAL